MFLFCLIVLPGIEIVFQEAADEDNDGYPILLGT